MKTLSGKTLHSIAIDRLRTFEPEIGYWVAYSGGKDSDVTLDLVRKSAVKYTAHHALTTADPPEVIRHVKKQADVLIHRPKRTMWELIKYNGMPPRRNARYCCRTQKEPGGKGFLVVTGIRRKEGANRSNRKMVEPCYRDGSKRYLNLIVDWSTAEIWEYIRGESIPYCSLYDEGFERLGCVLCPMNRDVASHMLRWPKLCRAWERAVKATFKPEKTGFANAEEYWQWWLDRDAKAPPKDRDNWLFDPWIEDRPRGV
jgi:phosphoadenosine phosphosulfate reductase